MRIWEVKVMRNAEEIFKKLDLETEESREKFNYVILDQEDEINVNCLGLTTNSY